MGNIGTPEILVVLIVALLVLGPTRLPQAARSFGKAMSEFRRVTGGLQAEMRDAVSSIENEINVFKDDGKPELPPPAPYVFDPPQVPPMQPGLPLDMSEPTPSLSEPPAVPTGPPVEDAETPDTRNEA